MALCYAGLFSFKNYQLMSVTDSLFRRSGRAVAKPIDVNLVRLIHLSPPPEALVNHILAPAVRQVYRKRCPTVS